MYHLIFIVKIKNNMTICILGNGLTALTLAKALLIKIFMLMFCLTKKILILTKIEQLEFQKVISIF